MGHISHRLRSVAFGLWMCLAAASVAEDDPTKTPDAYNNWKLALGVKQATGAGELRHLTGFKVELLRSAMENEGSWVSMAFDPQGRLTIAREKRGLIRLAFDANHAGVQLVEVVDDELLECRGLLYAYDALYANANNSLALYRLRDTDGDDHFDDKQVLLRTEGGVGHGRNHLKLGPDGFIYIAHGNDVRLPANLAPASPYRHFGEDQLIPCPWDDGLFNAEVRAPGGTVLRMDREGKRFDLIAGGFRNQLDVAFNEHGEMFTYDSDMEWDTELPWYRPTRVNHVVSGGEYGWRRGTGKWPAHYPDSLPAAVDIGLGSPTGIEFGTHSRFPGKYRRALYLCEWAYGRIIAVHLTPDGSSYTGTWEHFVVGRPLNVTDVCFGPDGAMYFITGGRGTQSGLYRVTWTGRRHDGDDVPPPNEQAARLRAIRRSIEALHAKPAPAWTVDERELVWASLGHDDRFIRFAARVALENQRPQGWRERALSLDEPTGRLQAALASARVGSREEQPTLMDRLLAIDFIALTDEQRVMLLRAVALSCIRHGRPDPSLSARMIERYEPLYPADDAMVNHELCRLLVYLRSPKVIDKTMPLLGGAIEPRDRVQYPFLLRYVSDRMTLEQKRSVFESLNAAAPVHDGRYYQQFIGQMRDEYAATLTETERAQLAPLFKPRAAIVLQSPDEGKVVKAWTMDDLLPSLERVSKGRSFDAGQAAFAKAQCALCHKFADHAPPAALGPDLTAVAQRFSRRDILESILDPSKVIDDKYRLVTLTLADGSRRIGQIDREDGKQLVLRPDPLRDETVTLWKRDIAGREPSPTSFMPPGLINVLKYEQILDLLAYLESGGDAGHPAFKSGGP